MKVRASQLDGCARHPDMHTTAARAAGETQQRMHALDAPRETPVNRPVIASQAPAGTYRPKAAAA